MKNLSKQAKSKKRGARKPSSARNSKITKKQAQALELRINGFTLNEIAATLGYADPSGAQRAIMAAQKKTLQEPADQLRKLHRERLSRLMRVLSTDLCAENEGLPEMVCPACGKVLPIESVRALDAWLDKKHAAIDRILKVLRREAEMEGLDAAKGVELQGDLKIVMWGKSNDNGNRPRD